MNSEGEVGGQRAEVLSTGGLAPPERMFDASLFATVANNEKQIEFTIKIALD